MSDYGCILSHNSTYPCCWCLVHHDDLANFVAALSNCHQRRTAAEMKKIWKSCEGLTKTKRCEKLKKYGLRDTDNFLWNLPYTDVYSIISIDTLHQIDIGVWGYHIMGWLKQMIEKIFGKTRAAAKFALINNRFSQIPSYSGLKIFKNGVTELARITACEWKAIQKVFII